MTIGSTIGYPHHVVQRGNNRADIFFDDEDRRKYVQLAKRYSEKWSSPIIAYCLMTNHCHLLIKPMVGSYLSKMMQGVTLCYTQYANRKYGWTGRPFGSEEFIINMEQSLNRPLMRKPRGRPKRSE